jgi:hypothetical protein
MITRILSCVLVLIGIASSPLQAACPGGVSTSFTVTGEVTNRPAFDLKALQEFAPAQAGDVPRSVEICSAGIAG